jgi:uncharacterized OsmC-like protein
LDAKHIQTSIAGVVEHLSKNPAAALSVDSTAVALLDKGLRCIIKGPGGAVVSTDMPAAIGGDGSAPGPGWLLRAALAGCDATMIAIRAAVVGVTLHELEVRVDSDSDDRGIMGMDDTVPAGPIWVRVHVRIVSDAPKEKLMEIIQWAEKHSPVGDAVCRSIPVSMDIETSLMPTVG